jgi:thioredoxin reductase (NADPH)
MKLKSCDVFILGGGVVGLGAAIYAGRLGLESVVVGKLTGGTITKTDVVQNYPGIKSVTGAELANKFMDHAKEYGAKIYSGEVSDVSWNKKRNCFLVKTKKTHYNAKTLLFATGAEWRKLDAPGAKEYENKGVHYCALCDGPLYKNKIVAVVGGGDSAAKEALLMAKYAKRVYVLARSTLKPEPINKKLVDGEKKISVIEGVEVKEVRGGKFVEEIVLSKKVGDSDVLKIDGMFVDIGQVPNSGLVKKIGVKMNKAGEIVVGKESHTNIKGVWAAGDVTDAKFKQAITGVGEAVRAVYGIYEYLKNEKVLCSCVDENC